VRQVAIDEYTELPRPEIIIGGPPCQSFSSAGMRQDDDIRNTLVAVFAQLVARTRPRMFVFENVEGFLTAADGARVHDLLGPLIAVGYRIHLRKVNAANYGVPQHRKRVIAIGGLGFDPSFPEPTHRAYGAPGAEIGVSGLLPTSPTVAEALRGLPPPASQTPVQPQGHIARPLEGVRLALAQVLKQGETMQDLPPDFWHPSYRRRAYRRVMDGTPTERRGGPPAGVRRLDAAAPSKAITGGAAGEFIHPFEDRFLTLRECARIQTFPDSFEFVGSRAEQALLIGNAVPPLFGKAIAASVAKDLRDHLVEQGNMEGRLLSFVPTVANGMSPALEKVTRTVEERFTTGQLTLL